jgi:adenylate cyclase
MTCSGCGFKAPADFAFCPKCGAQLPAAPAAPPSPTAAPDGDRRPVTVLFADLAGFTALSEGLDPEEVRAIQADLFREMSASIERYEGFVEKFVGDAVMAVFGAPRAHEDDPERGLRAALLMRDRMGGLNRRWERRVGRPLALHIGVNTGPVVAGRIGSSTDAAYAVTGDTVNTASRLQSAAPPGEILIGDATYQLTHHAFAFAPREEVPLKGKSEPVGVHRLLGPLTAPRSARGLEGLGLAAPLVGRERELRRMDAAFDDMQAGRAQVLSLIGEPGAGKSRLQREFFARLEVAGRLEGATIRRAACSASRPTGRWPRFCATLTEWSTAIPSRSHGASSRRAWAPSGSTRRIARRWWPRSPWCSGSSTTTRAYAIWSQSSSSARSSVPPTPWWSGGS